MVRNYYSSFGLLIEIDSVAATQIIKDKPFCKRILITSSPVSESPLGISYGQKAFQFYFFPVFFHASQVSLNGIQSHVSSFFNTIAEGY